MNDNILITLRTILENNGIKICSNPDCSKLMIDGYSVMGTNKQYCCSECLNKELPYNKYEVEKGIFVSKTQWVNSKATLEAVNNLLVHAPVLQDGKLGIKPIDDLAIL